MPVISFELGSSSANEHPATVKSSCQTSSNRLTHKNSTIAEEGRSKEGVGRGATSSLAKAERRSISDRLNQSAFMARF